MDSANLKLRRREELNGHRGMVVWFTGLSGAGKTTLARALAERLERAACHCVVMDGDDLRRGLCSDLGFSPQERAENIRRAGEMARMFAEAGMIVLAALISPYRADRARARALMPAGDFIEVHCHCPLEVCEQRDVKGLYRRARAGEISEFTGISSPYEAPEAPELRLDTAKLDLAACTERVLAVLHEHAVFSRGRRP
ncbi:adenylyl-sulfate kinase [Chitinimonas sp.]|uniref:adenylyl-sulfate kinase n=1 Tax=Chitinimonas sp. TaxID=1934313 RepID=UPI002F91FFA4